MKWIPIRLEMDEPDMDTPSNIVEAAVDAIRKGYTHYAPAAGLPELREAIANEVAVSRGIPVSPDEVVVVPGAQAIIFFSILALVEEDEDVIYPNPGSPIYESMINFVGANAVPIPVREERDFRLDADELASLISDRTKLIILNSPQNPTGGVITKSDMQDIATVIGDRDLMVLSDEISSRLLFEGEPYSIASIDGFKDRTIILSGFSNIYSMTGWGLGYGVIRADLAAQFARLATNSTFCTATFTQMAGIEAVRGDQSEPEKMRQEFHRRRDVFVSGLNQIKGFSCRLPKGAFYTFPNIKQTGWTSKKLADALLEDVGVAALSGTAFGAYGEGYLRFSTANSIVNLQEALSRINEWTKKNL